jgi:hypothetical protein
MIIGASRIFHMSSPSHHIFLVKEYQDADGKKKSSWVKVAALFRNKDGKGFNIEPDGKLVIREPFPKKAGTHDGAAKIEITPADIPF